MDEQIKSNLAFQIAEMSLNLASLSAHLENAKKENTLYKEVLNSDTALLELFNETLEKLKGGKE